MVDTLHSIGFYCGRFGDGFWGEPQNALTNLGFIVAAGIAWRSWRRTEARDGLQLALIGLAVLIGIGSFVFHTMPNPMTLQIDLVPIQVFGLTAFYYMCRRTFALPYWQTLLAVLAFFALRQAWVSLAPQGAFGGGITHVPTVLVLLGCGVYLRRWQLGRYLLIATVAYVLALVVRNLDVPLCAALPFGLHWLWHCLTAFTIGAVLLGVINQGNLTPEVSDGSRAA